MAVVRIFEPTFGAVKIFFDSGPPMDSGRGKSTIQHHLAGQQAKLQPLGRGNHSKEGVGPLSSAESRSLRSLRLLSDVDWRKGVVTTSNDSEKEERRLEPLVRRNVGRRVPYGTLRTSELSTP